MDQKRIEAAVRELLLAIGENPDREGLLETPRRVASMYEEVFSGLQDDPKRHLKMFQEGHNDEMVIVRDIPMYSMCEHHLLPFIGRAHIAYIPSDGRVIGLSKLARIVDCFAKRPQLQERLTSQVADFLFEELAPQGVAVIMEAEHLCMTMRGARAAGALTQTSALRGRMRSDAKTRAEVLSLLRDGRSFYIKSARSFQIEYFLWKRVLPSIGQAHVYDGNSQCHAGFLFRWRQVDRPGYRGLPCA